MKTLHVIYGGKVEYPGTLEGWEFYTAPRPIPGTKAWHGEFGWWAAIDPKDEYAELWRGRCEEDKASRVQWHSPMEIDVYLMGKVKEAGYEWSEWVQDYSAEQREQMYLDYMNGRE